MTMLNHSWYFTGRKLHAMVRNPWVLSFSVVQKARRTGLTQAGWSLCGSPARKLTHSIAQRPSSGLSWVP